MRAPFMDLDFDCCINLININCLSHIALIKAFLPLLKNSFKQGRGYGQIINVSSLAGLVGVSVRTAYSASKFGISGFSRALRSEIKKDKVKVQMIYPGYVQTNISINSYTGKIGEPFGKTDANIAEGMPVNEAAHEMLVAIFLGKLEYICSHKEWHRLMVPARNVCAWFEDFASSIDYKNQMAAIDDAK